MHNCEISFPQHGPCESATHSCFVALIKSKYVAALRGRQGAAVNDGLVTHIRTHTLGHVHCFAAHQQDLAGAGQSRNSHAVQTLQGLFTTSQPFMKCTHYASSHKVQWLADLSVLDVALLGWPA